MHSILVPGLASDRNSNLKLRKARRQASLSHHPPSLSPSYSCRLPFHRLGLVSRNFGHGPPDPKFEFGWWFVTASAPGHGPGRRNQWLFIVLLIDLCGLFRGRRGRALHLKLCILFAHATTTEQDNKRYSCPVPLAPKATTRLRSNAKIQQLLWAAAARPS